MQPDLSILIVNWNTRELLLACLGTISSIPDVEIIVVDNASADGSVSAVAENYPSVTLIANAHNVGFASANNRGLAIARGRHVLLLNPDTLVPPGSLETMIAYLDAHPHVGIVGPRLEYGDGSFQISALRFTRPQDVYFEFARFPRRLQPRAQKTPRRLIELHTTSGTSVDYVMGAALMVRRETAEAIGPMDEGFFMYAEEVDWCYRARAAGWDVTYLPTATVTHLGGQSTDLVPEPMLAFRFASTFRFMAKHYGKFVTVHARSLLLLAAFQNLALGLLLRCTGRSDAATWQADLKRNCVALKTALTGQVPNRYQMQGPPAPGV